MLTSKSQELEHKVHELEMQLQLKELVKTHTVINQAWEAEKAAVKQSQKVVISEEAQKAFAERLATAKKNAEILSQKRSEEEANILRYVLFNRVHKKLISNIFLGLGIKKS